MKFNFIMKFGIVVFFVGWGMLLFFSSTTVRDDIGLQTNEVVNFYRLAINCSVILTGAVISIFGAIVELTTIISNFSFENSYRIRDELSKELRLLFSAYSANAAIAEQIIELKKSDLNRRLTQDELRKLAELRSQMR